MPYSSPSDAPTYVPKAKRKQWIAVFNSAWKKAKADGKSDKEAESSAFAQANGVAGPNSKKVLENDPTWLEWSTELAKFGTSETGFVHGVFGPFDCGRCEHFDILGDYAICTQEDVIVDPEVSKDAYGNSVVEAKDCCNHWEPLEEEDEDMETAKSVGGQEQKNIFCPLVKVDAAKREVWGVVTAEEPDKDQEICDYESTVPYYKEVVDEMSKATDGANIFPLRAMHGLIAAGKGISIEFRKEAKEIFMGFKVVDDGEWKKVEENVYTGFSQGGRYVKKWKDGNYTRYTAQPGEVSLVDLPCLTRAHFEYVKADGTIEVRKFANQVIPTRPVTKEGVSVGSNEPHDVDPPCTCDCAQCKAGACKNCTANPKCQMCMAAGKVVKMKYLVTTKDGKGYLPYAKEDGKPDPRLLDDAWRVIHNPDNKAPDKQKALKRLKQLYAQEGLETLAEKSDRIDGLLKEVLTDVIQNRAYGQLNKGLYTVSRWAEVLEQVKYLWIDCEYERIYEEDASPATDQLKGSFYSLLDAFLNYTEEQVSEAKEYEINRAFKAQMSEV